MVRTESQGHKLSMAAFAERIKVSSSAVSQWETGDKNPSKVYIRAIASEFGINETWLLTGEGSMMDPIAPEDEVAQLAADLYALDMNSYEMRLIRKIAKLAQTMSDEEFDALRKVIKALADGE